MPGAEDFVGPIIRLALAAAEAIAKAIEAGDVETLTTLRGVLKEPHQQAEIDRLLLATQQRKGAGLPIAADATARLPPARGDSK